MTNEARVDAEGRLEFQRVLDARIDTVWQFLVDEELRARWLCRGKVDAVVGGTMQCQFNPEHFGQARPPGYDEGELTADFQGSIVIHEPPTTLAFTWPGEDGEADTLVTITLEADANRTLLTLVHERLVQDDHLVSAASGWHAHLEQLECCLSRQLRPNFWHRHHALNTEYRRRIKRLQPQDHRTESKLTADAGETTPMNQLWKKGRGKMGFMQPLIGEWTAIDPDTPMGKVVCIRRYEKVLDGKFILLNAMWDIGEGAKTYQENAYYGLNSHKLPAFWSFTSDGGHSMGQLADVGDMAPGAMGFEADMPAGLARFGFWPTESGMIWAAEAKTKSGWKSMIHHECSRTG